MNTIYNNEEMYNKFFSLVAATDSKTKSNGQFTKFFYWLYENNFLHNISKEDYEYAIEENELYLPSIVYNKIKIGINIWNTYHCIGIDPLNCFDKTSKCSILVRFPLSKREENRFYRLLAQLTNEKNSMRRNWLRNASTYYYGSYATFGDV